MKVSLARMQESRELRDIALSLLDQNGSNVVLVDRDKRIKTRQLQIDKFRIMQSAPAGTQILDVYCGAKVFSVNWDNADEIYVVAFKSGDWRQGLRALAPSSNWPIAGLPKHVSADGGPNSGIDEWALQLSTIMESLDFPEHPKETSDHGALTDR